MRVAKCARVAAAVVFVSLAGRCRSDDAQIRSNSVLWDSERWRPWVVGIDPDGITHLIGYNARLAGNLKLTSADDIEPRRVPFGFVGPRDTLRWTVRAPLPGTYSVAVLYAPGDAGVGSRLEVTAAGQPAAGAVVAARTGVWQGGPPDRPSFRRDWLDGTVKLPAGESQVTLRVLPAPQQQHEARGELSQPRNGWPKRSLHVVALELAQPAVLARMRRDATALHASTRWMVDGHYGLFIHWVPESYPLYGDMRVWRHYEQAVNAFDVGAFADMVQEAGAAWVVFTTTHGKYYFPGPLRTMDAVVPGRTCRRDLIGELAGALNRRGIRLMLYFHPGPGVGEDREWAHAAGISPVDDLRNQHIMLDMFKEIGERYGRRLAGWFIDGGYAYYVRNTSFELLGRALKAGNPDRVVTYFTWLFPNWSPFGGDFLSDVTYFGAPLPPLMPPEWFAPGGPYEGLQGQFNFTLEDSWYPDKPLNGRWPDPIYPRDAIVPYFSQMTAAGWPITLNVVITQDVTLKQPFVSPRSMQILREIRQAVK